ncbi:SPOR domain-containing protein [Gilvimarinus agarilyticus]|uniref:SPOR domain-containing protein n=1 Tax=Gilvimarinus agarilyticus TaxID=679259 RepID=UPI000697C72C|nr:hypothetical protein [Gilvimarinus agarilyticus]
MRILLFALLGINVAVFILQVTVWRPGAADAAPGRYSEVAGERLQLLSEVERAEARKPLASGRREASSMPAGVAVDGLCDMVGPFSALLQAEYLQENLAALDVGAEVREIEVPEGVGYWVHLPPEPSRKEALRRLHEVQAQQIDSYLIPRGELANGISFGMFSRKALGEAKLSEMKELGYAAEMREVARTHKEIWVVLAAGQGQKVSENAWSELLEAENGIEKQQKYCQGVAPE